MRRIGLTGSIGAGKSTAAHLLRESGLTVLDADAIARQVTERPEVLTELDGLFPGVVQEGQLDRSALAERVFGNPLLLSKLNALIHPLVRQEMSAQEAKAEAEGTPWIVKDIPLLFESGLQDTVEAIILIDADLETRVARVMRRSKLSRDAVLARDAQQIPSEEKRRRTRTHPLGFVIDNSGTPEQLAQTLYGALQTLGISPARRLG